MWRLRWHLFLISVSFGASGGLFFVIVTFPVYRPLNLVNEKQIP